MVPGLPGSSEVERDMHPTTESVRAVSPRQVERSAVLKATIDNAIEHLAGQLAEGHTEEYLKLLAFWSKFHRYSHGNVLLILSQRPDATQVAGYHRWKQLGRQVKKGAQAIAIWCPVLRTIEDPDSGLPVEQCVGFMPCPVFAAEDLVDIETNPLPTLWKPLADDVEGLYQYLVGKIEATGLAVKQVELRPGRQGFASSRGEIVLAAGIDSRNRILALLHELAHCLEHFRPEREKDAKEQCELEAESASVVVSAMLGIEHPTARDYLLSYQIDAEGLRSSLGTIQRIVGRMVTMLGLVHQPVDAQERAAA
jgi:hypothetical protein